MICPAGIKLSRDYFNDLSAGWRYVVTWLFLMALISHSLNRAYDASGSKQATVSRRGTSAMANYPQSKSCNIPYIIIGGIEVPRNPTPNLIVRGNSRCKHLIAGYGFFFFTQCLHRTQSQDSLAFLAVWWKMDLIQPRLSWWFCAVPWSTNKRTILSSPPSIQHAVVSSLSGWFAAAPWTSNSRTAVSWPSYDAACGGLLPAVRVCTYSISMVPLANERSVLASAF